MISSFTPQMNQKTQTHKIQSRLSSSQKNAWSLRNLIQWSLFPKTSIFKMWRPMLVLINPRMVDESTKPFINVEASSYSFSLNAVYRIWHWVAHFPMKRRRKRSLKENMSYLNINWKGHRQPFVMLLTSIAKWMRSIMTNTRSKNWMEWFSSWNTEEQELDSNTVIQISLARTSIKQHWLRSSRLKSSRLWVNWTKRYKRPAKEDNKSKIKKQQRANSKCSNGTYTEWNANRLKKTTPSSRKRSWK